MAVYIDSSGRLHHDQESALALSCPHCGVLAHVTPVSVPDYNALQQHKPSQVGLVYRCAACNAPVFLRFTVKLYGGSRVELAPNFVELERAKEKFSFTYLPEDTETLVKEAFACFTAGCHNAFASMCRRVAQATFADLGAQARLELFDELKNIRRLAELDDNAYEVVRKVLFDFDEPGRGSLPAVDSFHAGVLLEVLKDLLYQAYVRRGRLQQAMMVRRYFAEDSSNVTPLPGARP
jgi:DNA-directed RNA polymerase subunit RPC12/RpoP